MNNSISSLEKTLLLAAFQDLKTLRRGRFPVGWSHRQGYFAKQEATDDAKRGLVRLDCSRWLGQHLEASDRVTVSRAIQRLERRDLVERVGDERATHLFITRAGMALARELVEASSKVASTRNSAT